MVILVFLFSLIFITLSTVNAVSASPSAIYVNGSHGNDANDGLSWATAKRTIANATGTVSAGGTVNIANGIYRGSGNTNILINKSMTITGQSKSGTIINGTNNARIFQIEKPIPTEEEPFPEINVVIQNLTITNGNATTFISSVYNKGRLTVKNIIFKNNTRAIYNSGELTANGCTFTGNVVVSPYGGAIINTGTLNIIGSTFTENKVTSGGGYGYGGAIYNAGNLTFTSSTFTKNYAPHSASAIYNDKGNLTAHFNRIAGNNGGYRAIVNYYGTVDAEFNWWGSNTPAETTSISGFTVNKWLILKLNSNTSSVPINTNSKIIADLRYDNYGTLHTEAYLPNEIPVTFTTNLGTIGSKAYTVNGIAQSTLKSALGGTSNVSAIVDSQQVSKLVKIIDKVPPKVSSTYPKNLATGCSRTSTIYLKFNEKIKASTYWSKIYVKNLKTGQKVIISKSISGNTLNIKMSSRRYAYNWYQVYIPKAAVKDYFNNNLAGYYSFKFKTGKYPLNYQ